MRDGASGQGDAQVLVQLAELRKDVSGLADNDDKLLAALEKLEDKVEPFQVVKNNQERLAADLAKLETRFQTFKTETTEKHNKYDTAITIAIGAWSFLAVALTTLVAAVVTKMIGGNP